MCRNRLQKSRPVTANRGTRPFIGAVVLALLGFSLCLASPALAKDEKSTDGAKAAVERLLAFNVKRQWGPAYRFLHPAQKKLLTKDEFAECQDREVPEGVSVEDLKFIDLYKEKVAIPGTEVHAKSTALTIEYVLKRGAAGSKITDTVHVFWVKNKWTFVLAHERIAACTDAT